MRKIMYEDCNNNVAFLKGIFAQVQDMADSELNWSISNLDFISVDKGDFIGGVPNVEMKEIYDF